MSSVATSASFTWDDFVALDEDDRRELIDGELVETEVTNELHEVAVAMLCYFLTAWAQSGHGGYALASCYKIRISAKRGVMPDVQFYRRGNTSARTQPNGLIDGHPDLAVEIISPSSRRYDRVTKLQYYASKGVPEYWIVDPEAQTIEQLVLHGASYTIAASHGGDDVFRPATFEGLELPLAKLFAPSE